MAVDDTIIIETNGQRRAVSRREFLEQKAAAAGQDQSTVDRAIIQSPHFVRDGKVETVQPPQANMNAQLQQPAPQLVQQPMTQPVQQPAPQPVQQPVTQPVVLPTQQFMQQPAMDELTPQYKISCQPAGAMICTEAYVHKIIRHDRTLVLVWDTRSRYPKCLPDTPGEIALNIDGTDVVYLLKSEGINFPFDHWRIYVYTVENEYPYSKDG